MRNVNRSKSKWNDAEEPTINMSVPQDFVLMILLFCDTSCIEMLEPLGFRHIEI